jgi:hypothetical protein
VRGRLVTRGKAKRADYVLYYQHLPLALIEAKDNNHAVGDGMQQARNYNLDGKNPHTVADDHGDPAELLAKLAQDEQRTTTLRDQLKAILSEALLR